MIFEKKLFENYCYGKPYDKTLHIHLVTYDMMVNSYTHVFRKPMGDWLKKQFVLDAGCGFGHVMEDLVKNGVECDGYEPSNYANANLVPSVKDRIFQANHDEALPKMEQNEYDIVFANSLQYSRYTKDVERWVAQASRVCKHSMFFVSVTVQGMKRCVSGSDISKIQIIKSKQWWADLFYENGFTEVHWITSVMAICLKQPL